MNTKLLVAIVLLGTSAYAEKCRIVDTTTNAQLAWDTCQNAQSSAQWMADTELGEGLVVEHRSWWGRKWRVKIEPHSVVEEPEPEPEPEQEDPRPEMWRVGSHAC